MGLARISAFARPERYLARQTVHGAIVTLLGAALACTLLWHEVDWFVGAKGVSKMDVDLQRRHDLTVHVDVTFHAIPCAALSVSVVDASGTYASDVTDGVGVDLHKIRLAPDGHTRAAKGAGAEYLTPHTVHAMQQADGRGVMNIDLGAAMHHIKDMEDELAAHEACRLRGDVAVRRVAGKLRFAVHQQGIADMLPQMLTGHVLPPMTNMSHTVNHVSFGPWFPGQVSPLDGTRRLVMSDPVAYKYYLKVIPTEFTSRMGTLMETSQYSVTEYALPLHPPGAPPFFQREPFIELSYDVSPIMVRVHESPLTLAHFVVRLCAVVGGALSVTRLADKLVDGLVRAAGLGRPAIELMSSASGGGSGLLPMRSASYSAGGGMPSGGLLSANGSLQNAFSGPLQPLRHSSAGALLGGPLRSESSGGTAPLGLSHPGPRYSSGGGGGSGLISPMGSGGLVGQLNQQVRYRPNTLAPSGGGFGPPMAG